MSDTLAHTDHLPVPHAGDLRQRKIIDGFDYESLSPEVAQALRERSARIRSEVKKTALSIIAIGRELIAVKKTLKHGQFVHWVETECGFSLRSAQNYMRICRLAGKYEIVAHLPPSMAYRITRKRIPRELLKRLSARAHGDGEISETEFDDICQEFNKLCSPERKPTRAPSNPRQRPDAPPQERPSPDLCGLTKTEYAKLNVSFIMENFGSLGARFINLMAETDTFFETVRLLKLELCRLQFERKLEDL